MINEERILNWIMLTALVTIFVVMPLSALFPSPKSTNTVTVEYVRKVCQETGMYIQEGYVISCKVLDNNG